MKHRFGKRSMDVVSVVTDIGVQFTFPVAKSLHGTFGDSGGHCCQLRCASIFFTDRASPTSVPAPTRRCCTSCFEPVHVHGIEHHVAVRWMLRPDVASGESHKHDFVPHPTGTDKKPDQEGTDIETLFQLDKIFRMAVIIDRSLFRFTYTCCHCHLASNSTPKQHEAWWLAVIVTDGKQKPWHKQRDSVGVARAGCSWKFLESLLELHDRCARRANVFSVNT